MSYDRSYEKINVYEDVSREAMYDRLVEQGTEVRITDAVIAGSEFFPSVFEKYERDPGRTFFWRDGILK